MGRRIPGMQSDMTPVLQLLTLPAPQAAEYELVAAQLACGSPCAIKLTRL